MQRALIKAFIKSTTDSATPVTLADGICKHQIVLQTHLIVDTDIIEIVCLLNLSL